PEPRGAGARDQAVRAAAVAADVEQGDGPGMRVPGDPDAVASRPRVPAGSVPQLRVHRRGFQEEAANDRGTRDHHPADLGREQEARALPLRDGLRQRARARMAAMSANGRRPVIGYTIMLADSILLETEPGLRDPLERF